MSYMITSDGAKIYYNLEGKGKPIIFIHGFSEDHTSFRIQNRVLSKNYQIITYDLRGHGSSDKEIGNFNLERLAIDLKELIEFLKLKDVNLIGWSMGGSLIFEFIDRFGIENLSKICIIDKGPKALNDEKWQLGLYHGQYTIDDGINDLDLMKNNWMEFAKKFIKNMAPYLNEYQMKISMEKMGKNYPHIMYSFWKSILEKDYRRMLEKVKIPTLILFGEKSTLYSIETGEYLKENIERSNLIIFKNCTHLLVAENPIEFNRAIKEFI